MKTKLTIFLLAILFACSKEQDPKPVFQSDPALSPFVNQFYSDAEARGWTLPKDNLIVRFVGTKGPGWTGQNNYSTSFLEGKQIVVELDRVRFNSQPGKYKSSVYRECAHMLMSRPYGGCQDSPRPIMCPDFNPAEDDGVLWGQYLDKLFQK